MTTEDRLSRIEAALKKAGLIEPDPADLTREMFIEYISKGKIKEWNALMKQQRRAT